MTPEKHARLVECAKIQAERVAATTAAHQALRDHVRKQSTPEVEVKVESVLEPTPTPEPEQVLTVPVSAPIAIAPIPKPRRSRTSNKFGL